MALRLRAAVSRWSRGLASGPAAAASRQPGSRGTLPHPDVAMGAAASRRRRPGKERHRRTSDKSWSDDMFDERNEDHLPYGMGQRHARLEIEASQLSRDGDAARQTLQWHRMGVQHDHLAEDGLLQAPVAAGGVEEDSSWWRDWEAEWDEGWDWEDKWWPAPGEALAPRNDPRRPRGPLLIVPPGNYKQVAALNHMEVANAVVAAKHESPDELTWQALCRRAELVSPSFTPAEVLAVVCCVAERQAGQLKLLWKLAEMVVEKLASFTTEDLVRIASAYALLDAIHHGLLNVVALVLADPEDDRQLTPASAAELLKVFAVAKYPLPVIISEAKRVLLGPPPGCNTDNSSEVWIGAKELDPRMALHALEGLTDLKALDSRLLGVLLPVSLRCTSSQPEGAAGLDLPMLCAVSTWAIRAKEELHAIEVPVANTGNEVPVANTGDDWCPAVSSRVQPFIGGEAALSMVSTSIRRGFSTRDARRLRVIPRGQDEKLQVAPRCIIPVRSGHENAAAAVVPGEQLIGAAEMLLTSNDSSSVALAFELLEGATRGDSSEAWPLELQVRWLSVLLLSLRRGELGDAALHGNSNLLLSALCKRVPHRLVSHAPVLFQALPLIASKAPASGALELACTMAPEVRQNLFRLSLAEAHAAVEGLLKLVSCMQQAKGLDDAMLQQSLQPEAERLLTSAVQSLPAKFRSESIFHKKEDGAVSPADVVAWSELLADRTLMESAGLQADSIPEDAWQHLAVEAERVIAATGEPDQTVVALLGAFSAEGRYRKWSATDPASPLGCVAAALSTEWQRATRLDGELEDPLHEPLPISEEVQRSLQRSFAELGLPLPTPES